MREKSKRRPYSASTNDGNGSIRLHTLLIFIFTALYFWSANTLAAGGSNFSLVKLPRGVELLLPNGWWILGENYNRVIDESIEAAMDLSDIGLPDGKKATNLIAANSTPRTTYAAIRVDSTTPPPIEPAALASASTEDLKYLSDEIQSNAIKLLELQGNKLIHFIGVRREKISHHVAVVTEYRRTGTKGPVFVQINQIFTNRQEIRINISYRESETAVWKPIMEKVRRSISITPGY